MKWLWKGLVVLVGAVAGIAAAPSKALGDDPCRCGWCDRRPYGSASPGQGQRYGAKDPVKTEEEARRRLEAFYDDQYLEIGKISERPLYFEASVKHRDGRLVDRVIIDKRSGRIRSIL